MCRSPFDLREVGYLIHRCPDARQQSQPVLAQPWLIGINGDSLEKFVNGAPERSHLPHCRLEFFSMQGPFDTTTSQIQVTCQRELFGLLEERSINIGVVPSIISPLLDSDDV